MLAGTRPTETPVNSSKVASELLKLRLIDQTAALDQPSQKTLSAQRISFPETAREKCQRWLARFTNARQNSAAGCT